MPYSLLVLVAALIGAGLALTWWRAPLLVESRRAGRVRLVSATLLGLLTVLATALNAVGVPLAPDAQPLLFGGAFGGDDPRLLAFHGSSGPLGGSEAAVFAYAPGAELRFGMTLLNDGAAPLTIVGLEQSPVPNVQSVSLRLSPEPLATGLLPLYPDAASDRWFSETFRQITIPPHGTVGIGVAVTLGTCPGALAQPTRAPEATLVPGNDPALGGGFGALGALTFDYSVLGVERTAEIRLPIAITVFTGQLNVFGCPGS